MNSLEQRILLINFMKIVHSTVRIRRINGYASSDFKWAMSKYAETLTRAKGLPGSFSYIVQDFALVYDALERDNMHMLAYSVNKIAKKFDIEPIK